MLIGEVIFVFSMLLVSNMDVQNTREASINNLLLGSSILHVLHAHINVYSKKSPIKTQF